MSIPLGYLETVTEEGDESDIWCWLARHEESYQTGVYVPPMRRLRRMGRPTRFLAGQLLLDPTDEWSPRPTAIALYDGTETTGDALEEDDAVAAEAIANLICRPKWRGHLIVFAEGARLDLHILTRRYAPTWARLGYRVTPIAAGTRLLAVHLSRGRQRWTLADLREVVGIRDVEVDPLDLLAPGGVAPHVERVYAAVERVQAITLDQFRTPLGLTMASTAMRAALQHVPADVWKWRPPPGLVALCRPGGGYRGGYVYARPYEGPAHRLDVNKLYTWALATDLPIASAFGRCRVEEWERPGLYVCQISGPGAIPAYLSLWDGRQGTFVKRHWRGADGTSRWTILPTSEFPGLRALGFTITPTYGYVWTRTFTLSGLVEIIERIVRDHPRGHPAHIVAKAIGVSVYGKFGESSKRQGVMFATECPGSDWWPFLLEDGREVEGLWTRATVRYRSHQHVDIAATITGVGRSHLYRGLAWLLEEGHTIQAVDTDGVITSGPGRPSWANDPDVPDLGVWRYDGFDPAAVIVAARAYAFGHLLRTAGGPRLGRSQLAAVMAGDYVEVQSKRLAPPYAREGLYAPASRQVKRAIPPDAES